MFKKLLRRNRVAPSTIYDGEVDAHFEIPDGVMLPGFCPEVEPPSYEDLQEENRMLVELLNEQAELRAKARFLMQVLAMTGSGNTPVFAVNKGQDDENVALIRHAILDLQSILEGDAPMPPLVYQGRTN
jgi:hypothetical protein